MGFCHSDEFIRKLLIFAVRISLRKNPVVRDRLFTLVLAGAFAHGFYLVYPFIFFLNNILFLLIFLDICSARSAYIHDPQSIIWFDCFLFEAGEDVGFGIGVN